MLAHVWGLRTHLATTGPATPAVNLRLRVEGEEEQGSTHLAALLEDRRDRVGPTWWCCRTRSYGVTEKKWGTKSSTEYVS
jgi:hypothetical protein